MGEVPLYTFSFGRGTPVQAGGGDSADDGDDVATDATQEGAPGAQFKLPWREAGPPNHHEDKVDSDQYVVTKELSRRRGVVIPPTMGMTWPRMPLRRARRPRWENVSYAP